MRSILQRLKLYGFKQSIFFIALELRYLFYYQFLRNSFSQQQEDLVLDGILGNKSTGFYVDIGAFDPHRFSNTKRFYKKGWTGINIEPDYYNYSKFVRERPKDINLNVGIGTTSSTLKFYKMFPSTLSTFSESLKNSYLDRGFKLEDVQDVKVQKLADVLNKHCNNKAVDFFTIDTEGYDLIVLKSNNWLKYKPTAICIETNNLENSSEVKDFLSSKGYTEVYSTGTNSIYKLVN